MDTNTEGRIECQICHEKVHSIYIHLRDRHHDWDVDRYRREFPEAPLLSKKIEEMVRQRRSAEKEGRVETISNEQPIAQKQRRPIDAVFGFGSSPATRNARGEPIMTRIRTDLDENSTFLVPQNDNDYVFDIESVKNILIGLELSIPVLAWGMHGTGKTSMFEQICARTNRPFLRVQHTVNTEEAHIVGQWIVRDGSTVYQLGPLADAMMNGYVYCADEYDMALPSVIATYQPVLEGKSLVIKDAPPEFRIIAPHPEFRFLATGNTNGGGDETGLYQGTQMQNAANYSRFGITLEVGYMDPKIETAILLSKISMDKATAEKFVNYAREIREAFRAGRLSTTISPRELITAAKLGVVRGGAWRSGLRLALLNRMNRTDREVAEQFAQRVFGEAA